MLIDIKELSESDLKQKIENIKAVREKTADALKRYEDELERRKQEVPLGVPSSKRMKRYWNVTEYSLTNILFDEDDEHDYRLFDTLNYFHSKESAEKHAEMLLAWRKTLVANAKGEPIDIKVLLPLLKNGYVFYQGNINVWLWSADKPKLAEICWEYSGEFYPIDTFNLKPAEDWRNSLMECGL